ncbi:MAG TPA: hypothetical protein PLO51_03205 [Candidatus Micrarchaeota archaeon]|nr:hypothetical protein [Candidatus Micrarchaeota archaeon]
MGKEGIRFLALDRGGDGAMANKKNQSENGRPESQRKPEAETASAAIAYAISIILPGVGPAIIYFISDKGDLYARHHAAIATALSIAASIVLSALAISVVGLCLALPGEIAYVIGMLYLAIRAYNLEPLAIPIFEDFGRKFE